MNKHGQGLAERACVPKRAYPKASRKPLRKRGGVQPKRIQQGKKRPAPELHKGPVWTACLLPGAIRALLASGPLLTPGVST